MTQNDKPQDFAARLDGLVDTKGLKSDYVAQKVSISRAYLSRLRHGKAANPGFMIIQAMGDVFDVSPAYFFGEEDKKLPKFEDIVRRGSELDDKGRKALRDILIYLARLQENDCLKKKLRTFLKTCPFDER